MSEKSVSDKAAALVEEYGAAMAIFRSAGMIVDKSVPPVERHKAKSEAGQPLTEARIALYSHISALQSRAERAEAMIERLIEAGSEMYLETVPDFYTPEAYPNSGWTDWDAAVSDWQKQKGGEG